jgi:hypothetical protein
LASGGGNLDYHSILSVWGVDFGGGRLGYLTIHKHPKLSLDTHPPDHRRSGEQLGLKEPVRATSG